MTNKKFKLCVRILYYCLKCRKNTESKIPKFLKTKNGKIMLLAKCSVCISKKKSKFLKEQEAKGLLSILGLKTPLSQIPLLGPLCFKV